MDDTENGLIIFPYLEYHATGLRNFPTFRLSSMLLEKKGEIKHRGLSDEKKDEIKHTCFCVEEFQTNQLQTQSIPD